MPSDVKYVRGPYLKFTIKGSRDWVRAAVPDNWWSAGYFKAIQRGINDMWHEHGERPVGGLIPVDGWIGTRTIQMMEYFLKPGEEFNDLTGDEKILWAIDKGKEIASDDTSNSPVWLMVSPIAYRWWGNRALKVDPQ